MPPRTVPVIALLLASLLAGCASTAPDDGQGEPPAAAPVGGPVWSWTRAGPTLQLPLAEASAASSPTSTYLVGGFTDAGGGSPFVLFINFTTELSAFRTEPYPLPVHHTHAVRVARVVYAFGGFVGGALLPGTVVPEAGPSGWPRTDLAFKLDLDDADLGWQPIAPLPAPRAAGAVAELDGQVYLVGGISGTDEYHSSVLRYDPASDEYTELAPLPTPRDHLSLVAAGGRLYALAGRAFDPEARSWDDLEAFEAYDPGNDTWTALAPVPVGRGGQAAAVLAGRIVVAGGEVAEGPFDVLDATQAYDLANATWVELPPMAEPRHGGVFVPYDGSLFYLGGARLDGTLADGSLRLALEPAVGEPG